MYIIFGLCCTNDLCHRYFEILKPSSQISMDEKKENFLTAAILNFAKTLTIISLIAAEVRIVKPFMN